MQTNSTLVKFLLASAAIVVPAFAQGQTLKGVVTLSNPVAHATIHVLDSAGRVVAKEHDATNEEGFFSIEVPGTELQGLHVEANAPHGAHLDARVPPDFNANVSLLHLNVATTLVERVLELNPHEDERAAETRVRKFLELPTALDFGAGIDNPHLTVFSPGWFEHAAHSQGGFDKYTVTLAHEMTKNPEATHPFVGPEGPHLPQGMAEWVAEKLAGAVIGAAGSQIFSELQKGIGIPDKQSQILDLLTQVSAQIVKLQQSIDLLEKDVKEGQYNGRMQLVWDEWGEISKLFSNIMDQNIQAMANMKDGKAVNPQIAAQIGANIRGYEEDIKRKADNFITHVNTRFVVGGDAKPVQQLYAEYLLGGVVDSAYLDKLDKHIEKYRSLQILALTLLLETLRAQDNKSAADTAIRVNKPLIEAVKLIYPSERIFTLKDTLGRIEKKQALYDRKQDLLFENAFMHFDNSNKWVDYKQAHKPGEPMTPNIGQVNQLLSTLNLSGRFAETAKKLGFADKEANDIKMIVGNTYFQDRVIGQQLVTTIFYDWWGNDVDPRKTSYNDTNSQFSRVRDQFKMPPGFFTMRAIRGSELKN